MAGFEAVRVHLPSIDIGDLFDSHWARFFGVGIVKTDNCLPSMRNGSGHMSTFLVWNPEFMCNDHSIAASRIENALWCCSPRKLRACIEGERIDTQPMSRMAVGSASNCQRCRWPSNAVSLSGDQQRRCGTMTVDAEKR